MPGLMVGLRAVFDRQRLARGGRRAAFLLLAFLASLPLCAFVVAGAPIGLIVLVAALLVVTLWRAEWAWLAVIALTPFGDLLGRMAGWRWGVTEPLVLAFLAVWLVREALARRRDEHGTLPSSASLPLALAGLFALAVVASMTVQLIVQQVSTAFPLDFAQYVWRFLWHDYYVADRVLPAVRGAAWMLSGLGLFRVSLILFARQPLFQSSAVKAFAVAAAAVAVANVSSFLYQLLSTPAFREVLALSRSSFVIRDVNAGGSYFVMALFAASGLAVPSGRGRGAWLSAGVILLFGLWLSGSRTAIVAALLVSAWVAAAITIRTGARAGRLAVVGLLLFTVFTATFFFLSERSTIANLRYSLKVRAEIATRAVRIIRDYPVFGAGPGVFYGISADYVPREAPVDYRHENAHNNFLQVLAELGFVGLFVLVSLLWSALIRRSVTQSPNVTGWPAFFLRAGLLAFVVTWMAGHPLLVREVSYSFWALLGLTACRSCEETGLRSGLGHRRRWPIAVTALLIAVLVPLRADGRLARADLSRAGRGFSRWHRDSSGTRFRWVADRAVLYLPASARRVQVPMRCPDGVATVRLSFAGAPLSQVVVHGGTWGAAEVEVPRDYRWQYVPVMVEVRTSSEVGNQAKNPARARARVQVALPRAVQ